MGPELYLPLVLLFLGGADLSWAQKAAASGTEVVVEEGASLMVECTLRVEQRAQWRREGGALPSDLAAAPESAADGRLVARLHAARARAAHAGLYSCGPEKAQRVRVTVLPRRTASVPEFEPEAAPAPASGGADAGAATTTTTTTEAAGPSIPAKLFYFDVGRPFALNCSNPDIQEGAVYMWRKNDTAVEELPDLKGRYILEEKGAVFRTVGRTNEDDYGTYTCGVSGVADAVDGWAVRGRPVAKVPATTNVVEGQKLRIVCRVIGKPYPEVVWRVRNDTEKSNDTESALVWLGERASVRASEQGVEGAELVVEPAERADAGFYSCVPLAAEGAAAETQLRVKDKYAALWPFLGICAEVFILCAIILVYEKRRTKPELDDSDTDNHDQKKS